MKMKNKTHSSIQITFLTVLLVAALLLVTPAFAQQGKQMKPVIMPPTKIQKQLNVSNQTIRNFLLHRKRILSFLECVKEKMKKGLTKQEAILACKPRKAIQVRIMTDCPAIRKRMRALAERMVNDPKHAKEYFKALKKLHEAYRHCVIRKRITILRRVIFSNPCEEYRALLGILNTSKEKMSEINELAEAGEINASTVKALQNQEKRLSRVAEKLRMYCKLKKEIGPCEELHALISIRDRINALMPVLNDTEAEKVNETLQKIDERIEILRDKCASVPLIQQAKETNSLDDLADMYNAKMEETISNITAENLTTQQMIAKLKRIQEERRELIKKFVAKMRKLNLQRQRLIRRILIAKKVEADGVPTNITEISIVIGNQTVLLTPGKVVKITVSNETAESEIELELVNNTLIDPETNKTIKILPSQLKKRYKKLLLRKIILKRLKRKPVYEIEGTRKGKVLGFIPVTFNVKEDVDADTGATVVTVKPWWSFLVIG